MTISIFDFDDYKTFIKSYVECIGEPWGYWKTMALAIDCQPTYLSRCMSSDVHLTVDHILGICKFWSLNETDTEYFLLLLEKDRSATPIARKYFAERIDTIKKTRQEINNRQSNKPIKSTVDLGTYFSNWLFYAAHQATRLPVARSIADISKKLNTSIDLTLTILTKLEFYDLVERKGDEWIYKKDINLEAFGNKVEPIVLISHLCNWRTKALSSFQSGDKNNIHTSLLFSVNKNDLQHLFEIAASCAKNLQNVNDRSNTTEELVCFNLDLFKL